MRRLDEAHGPHEFERFSSDAKLLLPSDDHAQPCDCDVRQYFLKTALSGGTAE
jgi:hypothetical protein